MKRHPKMQKFIDDMTKQAHGISNSEAIEKGVCVECKKRVFINRLRDELNRKEYAISALCQECQDKVFGR